MTAVTGPAPAFQATAGPAPAFQACRSGAAAHAGCPGCDYFLACMGLIAEPHILAVSMSRGGAMGEEAGGSRHSAVCLRLVQLLPRISRGMRRFHDRAAPQSLIPLGPRHVAALEQLREGPLTVGVLATRLGLTLSTVSGVLADLDRAGFVARQADAGDRRRTMVQIRPGRHAEIQEWLDRAAAPLARVLDRLDPAEQAAFLKAMNMLETELSAHDSTDQ
jgi:DNA-binding MarR family transcriptional regulator